nr:MAG TPA: hypothetical protein [Caudoviricetes sp.]
MQHIFFSIKLCYGFYIFSWRNPNQEFLPASRYKSVGCFRRNGFFSLSKLLNGLIIL